MQPREDGVPRIGRGGGQDREVVLALDVEVRLQHPLQRQPLVEPQAVDDQEVHVPPGLQVRRDGLPHHVHRERRPIRLGRALHPAAVLALDVAAELDVEAPLLLAQRVLEPLIGQALELQLPFHDAPVEVDPPAPVQRADVGPADLRQLAHEAAGALAAFDLLAFQHPLELQLDLCGVDRLDQIAADALADGVVHELLFLALGHQDDREPGRDLLDVIERLEPAHAGHHLVEQERVVAARAHLLDGVGAVRDGRHVVALALSAMTQLSLSRPAAGCLRWGRKSRTCCRAAARTARCRRGLRGTPRRSAAPA